MSLPSWLARLRARVKIDPPEYVARYRGTNRQIEMEKVEDKTPSKVERKVDRIIVFNKRFLECMKRNAEWARKSGEPERYARRQHYLKNRPRPKK